MSDYENVSDEQNLKEEQTPQVQSTELQGIGGWLILPAIGIVISIPLLAIALILSFQNASIMVNNGYTFLLLVELADIVLPLVLLIQLAPAFFKKKAEAVDLYKRYLVINVVASIVVLFVELGHGYVGQIMAEETVRFLGSGLISTIIWFNYFNKSKRVKQTFIN